MLRYCMESGSCVVSQKERNWKKKIKKERKKEKGLKYFDLHSDPLVPLEAICPCYPTGPPPRPDQRQQKQ